ncbi:MULTISPECIES: DUF6011 domain-containing protein [unclassified Streptomyces]|uniref:DUF6011 domain-containing protein n=1 Tax=unclassified Streptomyces TaxID=2593676 RepID=UPI0034153420
MSAACCRMCGRRLRDAVSLARGTGPVCHAKSRALRRPSAHAASAAQLTITTTEEQP